MTVEARKHTRDEKRLAEAEARMRALTEGIEQLKARMGETGK